MSYWICLALAIVISGGMGAGMLLLSVFGQEGPSNLLIEIILLLIPPAVYVLSVIVAFMCGLGEAFKGG